MAAPFNAGEGSLDFAEVSGREPRRGGPQAEPRTPLVN
jgi:hypothetical protein